MSAKEGKVSQAPEIRPITRTDWPAIVKLFGENGACGGCWCMSWRVPSHGKEWEAAKGAPNRRALGRLVRKGEAHAVLAFVDGEPAAWCSFGPRESFPRLMRSRALARECGPDTWSIVCFFIPSRWRRRGIGTALLQAATKRAFELGAREVEGFPAVPWDPKVAVPGAFAWTGVPKLFEACGFERIKRKGRAIYLRAG
jgi:GNAT superfamily N-acetyltransferase